MGDRSCLAMGALVGGTLAVASPAEAQRLLQAVIDGTIPMGPIVIR
jgi:hypothetical protein